MNYHRAIDDQGVEPKDEQPASRAINLRDYWPPIYRARFAILAIFIVMISVAIAATLLMRPLYRGTATVEIRQEAQKVLGNEDDVESRAGGQSDRFLDTQLDIIRSRSTITAVAQSLGLYDDTNFLQVMDVRPPEGGTLTLSPQQLRVSVVNGVLSRNLTVTFAKNTRIARIDFVSPDAATASRVANSFAENYIRLNLDRRFDASRYSLDFLRNQLRQAQSRLADSERQAIAYARQARIIDASNAASGSGGGTPQSLTTASLVQLNTQLAEARNRRIIAAGKWATVRASRPIDVPEVMANPAIQQLVTLQATLRAQYKQQLETRQPDYPTVRQLAAQIAELDRQVGNVSGSLINSVRKESETAQAQEDALRRNFEQLKTATLDEQNRGVQLSILQREAQTNRQQLVALLTRYNELNAQSGVQTNNLSIIDNALPPTAPFWPSAPLNLALAMIVATALSVLYVLGRENLFEMIRTPKDVNERLHLPSLGTVPAADNILQDILDTKSLPAEAFSSIRTSLSLSSASGVPRSFMVTSTQAGEGKSTVCYGLAIGLARIGRKVVVVDADLRRPNVHRVFSLSNDRGVSNVIASEASIRDVIHADVVAGVDVVVAGPIPPSPAELLATDRLARMIAELETIYDHVLVDSAPVLGLADAPLVATGVHGMIFVIESARTSVRGAVSALARLQQANRPILGVVLSRFTPDKHGYSYDYRYEYNYEYGRK